MLVPNLQIEDTIFAKGRGWYSDNLIGSDTLVISVGDSWTWGDDLGQINIHNNVYEDYEYRTQHIYGQLIANTLHADFVNIAIPGGSNVFLYDKLKLVLAHTQQYNKIFVFVTLTEIGRELINDPIWLDANYDSIDSLLEKFERNTLSAYTDLLSQYSNVTSLVGRNFTFTYNSNKNIIPLLDKTWIDLLDIDDYPTVRVLTNLSIDSLKQLIKDSFKEELIDVIDKSLVAFECLKNSPYIIRSHPNEQAHKMWAEYLLSKL